MPDAKSKTLWRNSIAGIFPYFMSHMDYFDRHDLHVISKEIVQWCQIL